MCGRHLEVNVGRVELPEFAGADVDAAARVALGGQQEDEQAVAAAQVHERLAPRRRRRRRRRGALLAPQQQQVGRDGHILVDELLRVGALGPDLLDHIKTKERFEKSKIEKNSGPLDENLKRRWTSKNALEMTSIR